MRTKKITFFLCLLCSTLAFSQDSKSSMISSEASNENASTSRPEEELKNDKENPQNNLFLVDESEEKFETPAAFQGEIKNFKERSIGVLYMPIPLNFKSISFTSNDVETEFQGSIDLFSYGVGLALNDDFQKSGMGFGTILYVAYIGGDQDVYAIDTYGALKYDLPLGNRITTNFEISPLVGIGYLNFNNSEKELSYGGSVYASGGARITWRLSNTIFFGGDIQTVPYLFNTEDLLGVADQVDEATIKYKLPVQINFSLRFNLN